MSRANKAGRFRKGGRPNKAAADPSPGERSAVAWGLALAGTTLASLGLTILKELWPPAKEVLVRLGGHHWTGHALVLAGVYGASGLAFSKLGRGEKPLVSPGALALMILGTAAVAGLGTGAFFGLLYWLGH